MIGNFDNGARENERQVIESAQRVRAIYENSKFVRTIDEPQDRVAFVEHFTGVLPAYYKFSAATGLSHAQQEELVSEIANLSSEYDDPCINVMGLARAFKQCQARGSKFGPTDFAELKALIIDGHENKAKMEAIDFYSYAARIGLTPKETREILKKVINDQNRYPETFNTMADVLASLGIAQVSSDSVVRVIKLLEGNRSFYRTPIMDSFAKLIMLSPMGDASPQQIIDSMLRAVKAGEKIEEVLERLVDFETRRLADGISRAEIVDSQEEINRHFLTKSGDLEIAVLPYQTRKSLQSGIVDLESISASSPVDLVSGEGFWVFDPSSETWYSLGGKTEVKARSIRHNFVPYDISQLSSRPMMFHCHPQEFEAVVRPDDSSRFYPQDCEEGVVKFFTATASGADFESVASLLAQCLDQPEPHSFIVSSVGTTEIIYPTDQAELQKMAQASREIRDQMLLDFDWKSLSTRDKEPSVLTAKLIVELNQRLPEGFGVKFYPKGTPIDNGLSGVH